MTRTESMLRPSAQVAGRGESRAAGPLRVAWLGPVGEGGGRALGLMLLSALVQTGADVDVYQEDPLRNVPPELAASPGVTVVGVDTGWEWGRWYSRSPVASFASGLAVRSRAHSRLARMLVDRHRDRPYHVVFQFSQFELLRLRRCLGDLPPVVVHPCTHAAGELRWHRLESGYARQSEPAWVHAVTRAVLILRAQVQRRQAKAASLVVGLSLRFNQLVSQDYASGRSGSPCCALRSSFPASSRHLRRTGVRRSGFSSCPAYPSARGSSWSSACRTGCTISQITSRSG